MIVVQFDNHLCTGSNMVSFTQRVIAGENVMIREVDDEAVILDLNTEQYFGLDDVGTRMWQVLTEAPSIQSAFDTLLDEYEVDSDTLKHDLDTFIGELVNRALITLADN
jgi:hypothetical protein